MERNNIPNLDSLLRLWPVTEALTSHLPVGDLITLSRSSISLRAELHGFPKPQDSEAGSRSKTVRDSLNIGHHNTTYWQSLKDRAPFKCSSSPKHTKDLTPKPCRYCSRPVCDACIVKSSLSRGRENTFQNRVRYLCKECWYHGNSSRSRRLPLNPAGDTPSQGQWYDPEGSTRDYCTCTLKDNGTLCVECKDRQNWEAISLAETQCHGQDCTNSLEDEDKERHRICLWCDKALPRQIGGTTRHHWNQRMIEARARNAASRQADLEEYNRKRLKLMTMSRREMRGEDAVQDDPDADLPQFVRHLDTINYRSFMSEEAAPSGDAVYDSKRGYWRYNREFLLKIGFRCRKSTLPRPELDIACVKGNTTLRFARTNAEKRSTSITFELTVPSMKDHRRAEWHNLKAIILELATVDELEIPKLQQMMLEDYGFEATVPEYETMLKLWEVQDQQRRRKYEKELSNVGAASSPREASNKLEAILKMGFDAAFASISKEKRLVRGMEILTSSDSDEEGDDSGSDVSSDSLCEKDMWADFHRRKINSNQAKEDSSKETGGEVSGSSLQSPSNPHPHHHHHRRRQLQPSAAPISANTITTDATPAFTSAVNGPSLPPSPSTTTRGTNEAPVDPVTPTTPQNHSHGDDPPPYSANGWVWP